MNKKEISILLEYFNQQIRFVENTDIAFFYSRDSMQLLGYDRWENFSKVLEKAKIACENSAVIS